MTSSVMVSSWLIFRTRPIWGKRRSIEEAEVASGDAFDRGDGLGVGEVFGVEGAAEALPVAGQDEQQFLAREGAVAVGEPEAAVELGVVAEPLVDAGHPDEHEGDVVAVVEVSE